MQVVNARPNDKDAKLKFNECNKIVRKIAFEKAINVDDGKKSISESIENSLETMGKFGEMWYNESQEALE